MRRSKSDYVIQTVANALRLLEVFRDEEELGVTELSRRLTLHKNNAFRLLATLEKAGYIEQCSGTDRYRLGVKCLELGHAYSRKRSLAVHARPILEELSEATGESTHLGALSDFEVVHLDGAQPEGLVLGSLRIGKRMPLHCTALGKVLLAVSPEKLWEQFDRDHIGGSELEKKTAKTIRDRDKFFDHLRTVASQGFAVDREESAEGLCCAAAPVYDVTGRSIAAISLSGPAFRLTADELHQKAIPMVVRAAERLSAQLGYTGL